MENIHQIALGEKHQEALGDAFEHLMKHKDSDTYHTKPKMESIEFHDFCSTFSVLIFFSKS